MTRPMAPCATSSAALVTLGTSKRSEKSTVQMRLVLATVWRRRSSCSKVVQPGLSDMTSLPASMAAMARSARLEGISAITTRSMVPSASRASLEAARGTFGKRLTKPSTTSGSPSVHQPANSAPASSRFWAMPKICRCSMPRATNLIALVILQFHFLAGVGRVDDRVDQSVRQKSRVTGDDRRAS
ncbi:hypothetical protein D3C72_1816160 [compost metagenome]